MIEILVEQVAREIFRLDWGGDWDRDVSIASKETYIAQARAAMKATLVGLREPNETMLEEGAGVIPCGQGVEEGPLNIAAARNCWQKMIDVTFEELCL